MSEREKLKCVKKTSIRRNEMFQNYYPRVLGYIICRKGNSISLGLKTRPIGQLFIPQQLQNLPAVRNLRTTLDLELFKSHAFVYRHRGSGASSLISKHIVNSLVDEEADVHVQDACKKELWFILSAESLSE